jgi:RepB DNA-primase from phage plasmid
MNKAAIDFLQRCFAPGETIAILLRRLDSATPQQRIVALETALTSRYMAWLAYENSTGSNIYVAANPLRPGSRQRTKENISTVRHLYLDIDIDGDARLAALRESSAVPAASEIISTSPDKYQVLWRVDGFDFEGQERTLKLLAYTFGGDPACTDCNRVLRLPGFLNCKYDPAHHVTVEYPSNSIWNPANFRLEGIVGSSESSPRPKAPRSLSGKNSHSHSEEDWLWVLNALSHGKDPARLTRELAARRSDKSNPLYYAQRTVDVASARLWLGEGIRIDDVITMLEVRRRFDVSSTLCSARAREIAATAQRMIARRKTS